MRRTHVSPKPTVPTSPLSAAEDVIDSRRRPLDAIRPAKAETGSVEGIGKFTEVFAKDRAIGTEIEITGDEKGAGNASRDAVQFARLIFSFDGVFFKISFAVRHAVQGGTQ